MNAPILIELAHVVEQERLREATLARARARARRENRCLGGPGRTARAWAAFWAPRDTVLVSLAGAGNGRSTDLVVCADC